MNILNYLSYFLIAVSLYIVACVVDIFIQPIESKLTFIEAYDNNRVIYSRNLNGVEDLLGYNIPIPLQPGMSIVGVYEVKRYYSAENNIERIIQSPNREYAILNTRRTHIPGTSSMVSAEYLIPTTAPDGCGYYSFSRNSIVKTYNLLTYIRPHVNQTTPIHFCIKR